MRVFSIQPDGEFREYVQVPFEAQHEERTLESWLEANPDGIIEDSRLLIIGRQVATGLGSIIDLLGVDRQGDVVVIELKRARTPRDTVAQALEYASFAARLDTEQLTTILQTYLSDDSLSLAEYHREYHQLTTDEAVAFNKDQRIVIVGQDITRQIRETSSFLLSKNVRVTCVEFTFFEADGGTKLLSQEIVVGGGPGRPAQIASGSLPVINKQEFLHSLDENGRRVFSRILEMAAERKMPIHWGTRGFSLNVDLDGVHVAICFGYPPESVYRQTIYTALLHRGGISSKAAVPEDKVSDLLRTAEESGLFVPAGVELKCPINREMTNSEVTWLLDWLASVAQVIEKHGIKE